ncbi:MAG TPA: hypothetical protein VN285_04615 [Candidatus Deferrimicrobium sp.]|nr:hypothetical protein [Candidatus Deferrimicrobium sp.]
MTKARGLLAALAAAVIAIGCASDIVLEEPPSLKGPYSGLYVVTELGEQPVEHKQRIKWKFTDVSYNMVADTSHPFFDPLQCFCNVYGDYKVEDRVRLKQSQPGTSVGFGCETCRHDWEPEGSFDLDRSTDTLKLSQQKTAAGLLIEIKLLKSTEE